MRTTKLAVIFFSLAFLLTACASKTEPRGTATQLALSQEVIFFASKAKVTVNEVVMDFYPDTEAELADPAANGEQYIKVNVTVENVDPEKKFSVNPYFFPLNGANFNDAKDSFTITEDHVNDFLPVQDLNPGESVTGSMYFLVSKDERLEDLVLIYEGFDGTNLVDKEYSFVFATSE
jgi:hypothetical protein